MKHDDLMNKKNRGNCMILNYLKYFLVFISDGSNFVSVSPFASIIGVPVDISSSAVGLKTCAIPACTKKLSC